PGISGGNMSHATPVVRPRFSALSSAVAESLQTLTTARRPHASAVKGMLVMSAFAAALPVAGQAQNAPGNQSIEEVTVTGSRIRRDDFTANAPVVSIGEAMFDQT